MKKRFMMSGYSEKALFVLIFSILVTFNSHAAQSKEPSIVDINIQSKILKEERTFSMLFPEGYGQSDSIYPVLYTLDAENKTGFSKDCSAVTGLSREGKIPKMIIIGIWNAPGQRNRDMIPSAVSHRPGSGGAKPFLRFIKEELMPHVKKRFHASDESFLFGGSNAGLFAVFAMLEDPELFKAAVAASPMIGHCSEFMEILAREFTKRNLIDKRILYMIYGTEDSPRVTEFVPSFQNYIEKNSPAGFFSQSVVLEGEGHVPPASLEMGLRYIFSNN